MTDRQAKAVAMASLSEMYSWVPLTGYNGPVWSLVRGNVVYTFGAVRPKTALRRHMAVWASIIAHFLSNRDAHRPIWGWLWVKTYDLKFKLSNGDIPFYKAIWLSKL